MDLSRQTDLVKRQDRWPIKIIGVGAIGSNVANILGRMGFMLNLIDPQNVQEENLAPGMFKKGNMPKVQSVKQLLIQQGVPASNIMTEQRFADGGDIGSGIVIVGVDSMEARRELWYTRTSTPNLYIDARIGRKIVTVFAVENVDKDIKSYENSLMGEPEELPCGSKATAYTGALAGAHAAAIAAQFVQGLKYPKFVYIDVETNQYTAL
jgi:hypothetical protein